MADDESVDPGILEAHRRRGFLEGLAQIKQDRGLVGRKLDARASNVLRTSVNNDLHSPYPKLRYIRFLPSGGTTRTRGCLGLR